MTHGSVDLVRSASLSKAPYSHAAVVRDAPGLIFTAGACPIDASGATVAEGDVVGQARQVMVNLGAALVAAGARMTDVVKTTIYVASGEREELVAAWNVVRSVFGAHDVPSTLVGVAVLGYPGQLVEVEAVAILR